MYSISLLLLVNLIALIVVSRCKSSLKKEE